MSVRVSALMSDCASTRICLRVLLVTVFGCVDGHFVCVCAGVVCRHVGHAVYTRLRSAGASVCAQTQPWPSSTSRLKNTSNSLFVRVLCPWAFKGHTRQKRAAQNRWS